MRCTARRDPPLDQRKLLAGFTSEPRDLRRQTREPPSYSRRSLVGRRHTGQSLSPSRGPLPGLPPQRIRLFDILD
ncbi:hypothetical protein X769_28380 [Mesorhizobium sp. LSJC268A00]|nr:hypothetical protein X769_28380 [Mesorhizobium sp. LSJC268A00]